MRNTVSGGTKSPSALPPARVAKASSSCAAERISTVSKTACVDCTASRVAAICGACSGLLALTRTATRDRRGTNSRSRSSRFDASTSAKLPIPVRLPPGSRQAGDQTEADRVRNGSQDNRDRRGRLSWPPDVRPAVTSTMTVGLRRTKSAARPGSRSKIAVSQPVLDNDVFALRHIRALACRRGMRSRSRRVCCL